MVSFNNMRIRFLLPFFLHTRGQAVLQYYGSYVAEREKDDPSWDSNYTPSAIRADVLSHLD